MRRRRRSRSDWACKSGSTVWTAIDAWASVAGAAWANAGAPSHIAAARRADGSFTLYGVRRGAAAPTFEVPSPGRGHAAAHPHRALAVAFARRPGRFAVIVDCALGVALAHIDAPAGRHFFGHGAFDAEGALLFTSENAVDDSLCVIGVWDAADGFRRIGEFQSGGVGPREIVRAPGGDRLVVANGGIRTHPDRPREKLNLATMRPNLAHIDLTTGAVVDLVEPHETAHSLSLRHIAVRADGLVAVAGQWEGDPFDAPALLTTYRIGDAALRPYEAAVEDALAMRGYAGSVAWSVDGSTAAITGPRGVGSRPTFRRDRSDGRPRGAGAPSASEKNAAAD